MKHFVFTVEGLAPQYETGATVQEARTSLIAKLFRGDEPFGAISEGAEVSPDQIPPTP